MFTILLRIVGGALVTISGNGFGGEAEVLFGSEPCTVITQTYTDITCRVPANVNNKYP